MDNNLQKPAAKIRTYGAEFVFIGVLSFAALIGMMIVAYRLFIVGRVKSSEEFRTASYYAANSSDLRSHLSGPVEDLRFEDIDVNESEGFGVCEIYFDLALSGGKIEKLAVGLVKVADFWIVYEAQLRPGASDAVELRSTYQAILLFLEKIDYQEFDEAAALLHLIRGEMRQSPLEDFLAAKLNAVNGNDTYAKQVLSDLAARLEFSKFTVLYEEALLHFNRQDYAQAVDTLNRIESLYAAEKDREGTDGRGGLFAGLPKDPFLAELDPENVLASSRKLLALAYNYAGDFEQGLKWSEKAIEQAERIDSAVIRSGAVYLKALNLYSLGRYQEADKEFATVISDLDNPNLSQKAWSYYFRADVASREGRPEDSLDYYEMAVTLDPTNAMVRRGAIEYLVARNYVGDFEIALGMALRGLDYGVEKDQFKTLASDLYRRLGLADKTAQME
jgi:tetratricopeptide (TPR) repeat protein